MPVKAVLVEKATLVGVLTLTAMKDNRRENFTDRRQTEHIKQDALEVKCFKHGEIRD